MLALLLAAALQANAPLYVRGILDPSSTGPLGNRFVEWQQRPTIQQMFDLYPAEERGRLGAALKCHAKRDGRLTDCKIWITFPEHNQAVTTAALRLTRNLQVTPEFAAAALAGRSVIMFDIIFEPASDQDADWAGGACPPPFCIPVPPPPPPP